MYKWKKRSERDYSTVPFSVQQAIPIRKVYDDGIFEIRRGVYSKTFKFTDINFATASEEDKEAMIKGYGEVINTFDPSATTKITINNRKLNKLDFEENILLKLQGDELDVYREEYNQMLTEKVSMTNSIIQDKYITVTTESKSVEEARTFFIRTASDLATHLAKIGSRCYELDSVDRLRIIHDFYRSGEEESFHIDLNELRTKGHGFKDYISPDSFEFKSDYFKMGNRFGRVMYLRDYASTIRDDLVAKITSLNRNMMVSIDAVPTPTDVAIRFAQNKLLGVETNITNWQRRQNSNYNFSANVPFDMDQQRKEMYRFLEQLTDKDQNMLLGIMTVVHTADTKAELDDDTQTLMKIVRDNQCQFGILMFQQLDGMRLAMPFGEMLKSSKVKAVRTLITSSLAIFVPFQVQEIQDRNGIYYGQNVMSKNMIIIDRRELLNGNSFIYGTSGSGKSFIAKNEIISIMLSQDCDVIIVDPEREYTPLVKALGGEVIDISATSKNHINAMEISKNYGDGSDPIILKSEFLLSLCSQLVGEGLIGPKEKSIIDRCTANIYKPYLFGNGDIPTPTLKQFREELLRQPEQEAKDLALDIELFTNGSLNTFAKETNVDIHNRLVSYDILDLGKQLMPIGMLVVLDNIMNRITANKAKGRNTFIFIDEIYLLFQHDYSANFLFTLWKRVRKSGGYCTGITQNVEDMLQSHTATTMMANSEFLVMLNQAATDRDKLAPLLNISDEEIGFISNVDAGQGLIKIGSSLVPFENKFPKNTQLYKLMTTKLNEK